MWYINGKEIRAGLFCISNLKLPKAGIKWKWECFTASEMNKLLEITGAETRIFQNAMCHSSGFGTCGLFVFMDVLLFMITEWWVKKSKRLSINGRKNCFNYTALSLCHGMKITWILFMTVNAWTLKYISERKKYICFLYHGKWVSVKPNEFFYPFLSLSVLCFDFYRLNVSYSRDNPLLNCKQQSRNWLLILFVQHPALL